MLFTARASPQPPRRWPGLCALCRDWSDRPVCEACVERFAPLQSRCSTCASVTPRPLPRCGACLALASAFDGCIAGCDYGPPWSQLIADFKFHQQPEWADAAVQVLMQALAARPADTPQPQLLLPVPLSRERLRERGYNQAWELARRLGRQLGIATNATLLQRSRDTAHQIGMTRHEREHNLRDAFWVAAADRVALQGRAVALIDDVLTTGATAHAAAAALKRCGASRVDVWVVARTPAPDS